MKRAMLLALVISFTPLAALAQSKGEQELLAAEESWRVAYEKCDVSVLGRILSNDLTLIQHVNGSTMGKEAFVKSAATCSIARVENHADRVRVYGDTAVVQGRSTYTIKKMTNTIGVIYTRVWVKVNGQWQVTNHQSTGLPAAH
jgi:ketosteroid isomerase-like protein